MKVTRFQSTTGNAHGYVRSDAGDDKSTDAATSPEFTIEVFINGGEAVISDRIFPTSNSPSIEVFAGNESAKISSLKLHQLKSTWPRTPQVE